MGYRDDNEALRARVEKLEEENRGLRAELSPPREKAPEDEREAQPRSSTQRATVPRRRRASSILGLVAVLSCGLALLYFTCAPVRAVVWRGTDTFECPVNGDVTLRDKTIRVREGPAIKLDVNCKLTLVHCDIRGRRGLELSTNNVVVIQDSRIEVTEVALAVGVNGKVDATGSTILGEITPPHATVLGVTDLPLDRVLEDRHAVDPKDFIPRARELARLGAGAKLREIDALHVDSRGLVDLAAPDYRGKITYTFEEPVEAAVVEAPPVRPGLPVPYRAPPARRMRKGIDLDAGGMRVAFAGGDSAAAVAKSASPRCSFAQVWAAARAAGAPENGVAHVEFDASDEGSWRLVIQRTPIDLDVSNETCLPRAKPAGDVAQ